MKGRPRKNPVPKKNKGGCPLKKIDWAKVDAWLEAGCTGTEIAACLGIHYETLYRRCEKELEIGFSEYASQRRSIGDAHLRTLQQELANDKDRGMLIWLGKQRLKQKDKPDEEIEDMEKDLEYLQRKIEAFKQVNDKTKAKD